MTASKAVSRFNCHVQCRDVKAGDVIKRVGRQEEAAACILTQLLVLGVSANIAFALVGGKVWLREGLQAIGGHVQ